MRVVRPRAKDKAIETAAGIYRREIGSPPTIEQLATRVGLNRNELTNGFRDMYGLTPHAYGHMLRMEQAVRDQKLGISADQAKLLERFSPEFRERHIEVKATG